MGSLSFINATQNQSVLDFLMLKGFQQGAQSVFGMKPLLQKVTVSSLLPSAALLSWYEYNIQYKYNSSLYCLQLWLHSGFSMLKVFFEVVGEAVRETKSDRRSQRGYCTVMD